MSGTSTNGGRHLHIGFRTSIITVFIAVVLFVGLILVYLSFDRVSSITRTAASTFIEKVAQLGADRIDAQFKSVRDSLDILAGLPPVQSAEIEDNPRLYALMASMLRNNPQLFSLYVGYEDGSFLEMDFIDRAKPGFRASLNVDEDAVFRLVRHFPHRQGQCCVRHAIPVREPDPGRGGTGSDELRSAPASVVRRCLQGRKDLADRSVHFLCHRRARLHVPHPTQGRPPRRRRRRPPAQPAGAIAGPTAAWPVGTDVPVQRGRQHRRPSRDGQADGRER